MPARTPKASREWTVGEVAARTGLPVSTLHFYERQGLVAANRTAGNQRRYDRAALRKLSIIRFAQELGIPLKEVAEALGALPEGKLATGKDWEAMAGAWAQKLEARIARLERLRDNLAGCIGCGCLSLERCAIYNKDDCRAAEGPGARTLVAGPATPAAPRE